MTTAQTDFQNHNMGHAPVALTGQPENLSRYAPELYQILKDYQGMIGSGKQPDLEFKMRVQSILALIEGLDS